MTVTVRDIVKGALRKLGVLAVSREPTGAQAQAALGALQSLYRELVGQGSFGRFTDVLVTTTPYNARENERVVCDLESGVTVNLPETITESLLRALPVYDPSAPDYGRASCETLPRPPRDGACIIVADVNSSYEKYYLYDANRAYWVLIDDLTLDSRAPLANRNENGLKAMLASRMASDFGVQVPPVVASETNTFRYILGQKPDRVRSSAVGQYF